MQIDRLNEYDLTPDLEVEINALLERGFQEDFGGRSFHQQRHHMRFIARADAKLIGHMAVCYRSVRLDNDLITICGLAEVVTAPEARGKGVATALLTEAIAFAKSTHAQFFVLFGDRPIYAGFGFENQPNSKTEVVLNDARTGLTRRSENPGVMVLPLTVRAWNPDAHLDLLGHKF